MGVNSEGRVERTLLLLRVSLASTTCRQGCRLRRKNWRRRAAQRLAAGFLQTSELLAGHSRVSAEVHGWQGLAIVALARRKLSQSPDVANEWRDTLRGLQGCTSRLDAPRSAVEGDQPLSVTKGRLVREGRGGPTAS